MSKSGRYITKSFPIKPFSCIVQYGHSSSNSKDPPFDSQSLAEVHTLIIRTKDHGPVAEGDVDCSGAMLQEVLSEDRGSCPSFPSAQTLKSKVQREGPMEGSTSSHNKPEVDAGSHARHTDTLEADITSAPVFPETDILCNPPGTYKQCEMNIVVNINQSHSYLLSGQRSSYQKILSFEKDGINVVERDLLLPIDLILSSAVCLVWYTKEKLSDKESSSSQITQLSCIDRITNDIMKALSFSFKTCIMVFEGESEFVAEAMKMLNYLHAAAIGLDIQLQCFISGSSSTTDIIITNCILELKRSRKTTSFPAMLEAETFAESFLTEFASINAVTAHAILSCGIELSQFMSLKVEEQLKLTELFALTERSLVLFKQQCQSGSSRRHYKRADQDRLCVKQSETRDGFPASSKVCPFKRQPMESKQSYRQGAKEAEWLSQTALNHAAVDDFLHPNSNLWQGEIEDYQDKEHACIKESPKDMHFGKGKLQSFDSPVQKDWTPSISHNYDTKLKRTMDLILKRNAHPVGTEGFQVSNEAKTHLRSPVDKHVRSSWFELDQDNTWLCSPVGAVLSPELDPGNVLEIHAPQHNDARRFACTSNRKGFEQSEHSFPGISKLSPELKESQWLHTSFLGQKEYLAVHKPALKVDLEDLFEYPLSEDLNSRQSEKECPLEFANETRAHLKRKLDFECPCAAGKCFKTHPEKGQKNSEQNFFDRYRYEGKEEPLKVHKTYSQNVSVGTKLSSTPSEHSLQNANRHKRLSTPNLHSYTHSSLKRCSPGRKCDTYGSPARSKGLCPSWTPHDKRSKKVLSFAKRGNDCQSRLVWETSKDASTRGKSASSFQKLF